ncbi:hypothetical protein [Solibacillus sp. CAU 1738]|uniref:hypothetical protein n=1 Tax=Solibacillus sp. CAU 1738 TaxID=3140363 RepID=UPI003260E470
MKKRCSMHIMIVVCAVLLSACMYPEEQRVENQVPDVDQLAAVQRAVEQFQADTGVLPIKTRDMDTDIFIKYLIDFEKLVPKYIASPPPNSYEKGGIFQYIIWDPEEKPTVKLVDLRAPERIREVKIRFISTTYPQYKDQIAPFIYTINYKNIGYKEEISVPSPYSNNLLPLVVSSEGNIYVDYSMDLYQFIQDNDVKAQPGDDLRLLLVEHYPVVPAYSLPYTVDENNEPVFMYDPIK